MANKFRKKAKGVGGRRNHDDAAATHHPDHSAGLIRLKRVQGQLEGIGKMIKDRRYCVDILVQFRAAMSALRNLEIQIFERHLAHCVSEALSSKNREHSQQKIRELTELLARRTQL